MTVNMSADSGVVADVDAPPSASACTRAPTAKAPGEPANGNPRGFDASLLPWPDISRGLDSAGYAVVNGLIDPAQCEAIGSMYDEGNPQSSGGRVAFRSSDPDLFDSPAEPQTKSRFRSRVVMERYGFGRGEYQYFSYPLPAIVATLRQSMYPHLRVIANTWNERMGIDTRYPADHAEFIARCHAAGQLRPTPLLLKYGPGDYNCLHQDLYGEHVFPLQMTVLLSEPGRDFEGGEFVITEQRPRMQSRPMVVRLNQGDAVILAVHHRPVQGTRGTYRVNLRHGVSELRSGLRYTMGVVFHDAT
ncbi:2OG-Fe(II) oxygenase [soil metagenome]